jgi:hypothetical protein
VLTDQRGALAHAAKIAGEGRALEAAEIALEAGDPRLARAFADRFRPASLEDEARKLRLEADAYVLEGDRAAAEERLATLEKIEGWHTHSGRQRAYLRTMAGRARIGDGGLLLYALSVAWMLLVGSRELLRLHKESVVFAIGSIIAVGALSIGSVVLANAMAIVCLAILALIHAAAASMRRLAPSPRWRLILLTFLILGSVGAIAAVVARLNFGLLLSAVFG